MRNRIRVFRAERHWSQAELAGRLKVSRQTINAIETDKYNPSLPLAFQIAKLFNHPIEAIFEPDAEDPEREGSAAFLEPHMAGKM